MKKRSIYAFLIAICLIFPVMLLTGCGNNNKEVISAPTLSGTYTYTGSEQTATLSGFDEAKMEIVNSSNKATNAGSYKIKVKAKDNYIFDGDKEEVEIDFVIAKKVATLSWKAPESLEYDGEAKTPTVSVSNLAQGDVCNVTAHLTNGKDNVEGTFTFTATALSNSNYTLPSGVTSPEYSITDSSLQAIYVNNSDIIWLLSNGKIQENYLGLRFTAMRSEDSEDISITSNMVSYTRAGNATEIEATVSYHGKTDTFNVHLLESEPNFDDISSSCIFNLDGSYTSGILALNKDVSGYYVELQAEVEEDVFATYYKKLTQSMILESDQDDGYVAFDFANAIKGKYEDCYIQPIAGYQISATMYVYSSEDVTTTFGATGATVVEVDSTQQALIDEIVGKTYYYFQTVEFTENVNSSVGFEAGVSLTSNMLSLDDVDLENFGMYQVSVNYNGFVGTLTVSVIPSSTPTTYTLIGSAVTVTIDVYDEGCCVYGGVVLTYEFIDEANSILKINYPEPLNYSMLVKVDNSQLTIEMFKAESLGGVAEEYYLSDGTEEMTLKVYTKNSKSYVDTYLPNEEDPLTLDYTATYECEINDGIFTFMGMDYIIGEYNVLTMTMSGEVVYSYTFAEDPTMPGVVQSISFNDNGIAYCCTNGEPVMNGTWTLEENTISVNVMGMTLYTFTVNGTVLTLESSIM